jgi:hypothetical protein
VMVPAPYVVELFQLLARGPLVPAPFGGSRSECTRASPPHRVPTVC